MIGGRGILHTFKDTDGVESYFPEVAPPPAAVRLETNKTETYTVPSVASTTLKEITPSGGYDGMKKASITLNMSNYEQKTKIQSEKTVTYTVPTTLSTVTISPDSNYSALSLAKINLNLSNYTLSNRIQGTKTVTYTVPTTLSTISISPDSSYSAMSLVKLNLNLDNYTLTSSIPQVRLEESKTVTVTTLTNLITVTPSNTYDGIKQVTVDGSNFTININNLIVGNVYSYPRKSRGITLNYFNTTGDNLIGFKTSISDWNETEESEDGYTPGNRLKYRSSIKIPPGGCLGYIHKRTVDAHWTKRAFINEASWPQQLTIKAAQNSDNKLFVCAFYTEASNVPFVAINLVAWNESAFGEVGGRYTRYDNLDSSSGIQPHDTWENLFNEEKPSNLREIGYSCLLFNNGAYMQYDNKFVIL